MTEPNRPWAVKCTWIGNKYRSKNLAIENAHLNLLCAEGQLRLDWEDIFARTAQRHWSKKQKKEFEKRDTLNWKLEMRKQKEALLGRVEADE